MTQSVPELNILVVEDEDTKLSEWTDAIDAHNADVENKKFRLQMVTSKNVEDAKRQLDLHRLDAAVGRRRHWPPGQ